MTVSFSSDPTVKTMVACRKNFPECLLNPTGPFGCAAPVDECECYVAREAVNNMPGKPKVTIKKDDAP